MGGVDTYQVLTSYDTKTRSTAFQWLCSNASSNISRFISGGNLLNWGKLAYKAIVSVELGQSSYILRVFLPEVMKHLTTILGVHVLFMYCLCAMRLGHHAVFSILVFLFLFCLSYIQTQNNSGDWLTGVSEDHSHELCCSFGEQMSCHHWVDHSMFLGMTALVQVDIKWSMA